MSDYIDLDALWKVLALSVAFGAGIVALYSLGLRALVPAEGDAQGPGRTRRVLGAACLLVCLAGVVLGIWVMLSK